MFENCRWLNEPQHWSLDSDTLKIVTDLETDFWRETHYGFVRDTGHAFLAVSAGTFTVQVRVRAKYRELYDQAGLMIRLDEKSWVKVGVEYIDGRAAISAVLTVPNSDWSTGPFEGDPSEFWVRATVVEGVLRLQISMDGETWPLFRLCPFPRAQIYRVGPMCCSPKRAGLEVEFSQWSLGSPFNKDLHDLT